MTRDPLVDVTRLLAEAVRDPGDLGEAPAARSETIEKLRLALQTRARRARRRRILQGFAAAAAVAALVGAGALAMHRSPRTAEADLGRVHQPPAALMVVRDGHAAALGADAPLAEGSELRTPPEAEARLDFVSGTKVTIGRGTHVRLVEQTKRKRFALEAGSFTAKVAKLGPDERFVVATSDSEVEVRGTQFRVSVVPPDPACGGGTPTRLEVTEGVVAIRHGGVETLVRAGGKWPACEPAAKPASSPAAPDATPAAHDDARVHAPSPSDRAQHEARSVAPAPSPTSSSLVEQNELYGEAMTAKRDGRNDAALGALDRLLATYPQGPLAESARLQRMRVLATTDRARASAAAADYLQRYPRGFGRAEAEALANGSR